MFSKTAVAPPVGFRGAESVLAWLVGVGVAALAVVAVAGPAQADTTDFVSTWDTRNTSTGSSAANQVRLPLESGGTYNFSVDWDSDGTVDQTVTDPNQATHTYPTPGVYTITISFLSRTSTLQGWRLAGGGDRLKILNVGQWGGKVQFGNNGSYFQGAAKSDLQRHGLPRPD